MAFLKNMFLVIVLLLKPAFCFGSSPVAEFNVTSTESTLNKKKLIVFKILRPIKTSLLVGFGTSFLVTARHLGSPFQKSIKDTVIIGGLIGAIALPFFMLCECGSSTPSNDEIKMMDWPDIILDVPNYDPNQKSKQK